MDLFIQLPVEVRNYLGDEKLNGILSREFQYSLDVDEYKDIADEFIDFLIKTFNGRFNVAQHNITISEIIKNANFHGGNYLCNHLSKFN